MNKVQLESLLKENPAAIAAVQKMTAIKLQGKGKREVQAATALKDEEHPSHIRAVSIFQKLKDCEDGLSIDNLLEGPVCHSGFKRLN